MAANPTLPAQHAAALARDPDNQVRAAVAARRDLDPMLRESIPVDHNDGSSAIVGWLLAQTAAEWTSYSRWDMLAHKNFPADAATRLARSDESRDRAVAAAHPGLAADVIEALLTLPGRRS